MLTLNLRLSCQNLLKTDTRQQQDAYVGAGREVVNEELENAGAASLAGNGGKLRARAEKRATRPVPCG